jgi:hypothetical protein
MCTKVLGKKLWKYNRQIILNNEQVVDDGLNHSKNSNIRFLTP